MIQTDYSAFNKPPYFPEWLCKDETLLLATLPDKELAALDDSAMQAAGVWSMETATGEALEHIGKLLGEERNGDDDEALRLRVKLRAGLFYYEG